MLRSLTAFTIFAALLLPAAAPADWSDGLTAFTSKNYQAAAVEFQQLVDQSPDGFQGHYMLGVTLEKLNRDREALNHLRKAYDLNPNDLKVRMALGSSYSRNRRYSDAAKLLSSVDPSPLSSRQRSAFYQIRGQSRLKSADAAGALKDLRALAHLNPSSAEIQFAYGSTALSLDRLDEAITAFGKASQLAPRDQDKKRAYANALIKKGRLARDKAVKRASYTQAAAVTRDLTSAAPNYDNLMLQVSAELGAGLYEAAIASGKTAITKSGNDWLAHYYLGQAYSSAGQFRAAEAPLDVAKSKAREPEDLKRIWRQLGFVYEKQTKYAESSDAYEQAGDRAGLARVQENQQTAKYNRDVEKQNQEVREMEQEAKAIEEELKKLQAGGGPR